MSKKLVLALGIIGFGFVACEKKEEAKHEDHGKTAEHNEEHHAAPAETHAATAETHAAAATEQHPAAATDAHKTEAAPASQVTPAPEKTEKK